MGWLSFNPTLVCFSALSVPSVPVQLLPGAQRGAVQAAAQAGAAAALLAAAGAAEGQVAPAGTRPGPFLPPLTPPPLRLTRHRQDRTSRTPLSPAKTNPQSAREGMKTPQSRARRLWECRCCQRGSTEPFGQLPGKHGAFPGSRAGSSPSLGPPLPRSTRNVCRTDGRRTVRLQSVRTRAKDGNVSRWTGRLVTRWAFPALVFKSC